MAVTLSAHALREIVWEHLLAHDLDGWTPDIGSATNSFGRCIHSSKIIRISLPLARLNPDQIVPTILHEIAHALVGPGHGHGRVWQRKVVEIGGSAERCWEGESPPPRWVGTCPTCGETYPRQRLTARTRESACSRCCRGRYNLIHQLTWKKVGT